MSPRSKQHSVWNAVWLGIIALALLVAANYQAILDQYALATFHPSAEVASTLDRIDLTEKARATFYRSQPQIDDKTSFNTDCETQPHELELGCYFRGRIYVLQIDNPSLASEMDVVAAHELLHAVWDNMSTSDQKTIGDELERVYAQMDDSDLKQRMAAYAQSEPGEQSNELHSILGTEYANLSPLLEQHYAKYFTNRSEVVAAHAAYQSVFNNRRTELETELSLIRSEKGQLGTLNAQLAADRSDGQIDLYNSLVPRQNQLVDEINQQITSYRQGVDEYNALSKSLDSQEITDTESTAQ